MPPLLRCRLGTFHAFMQKPPNSVSTSVGRRGPKTASFVDCRVIESTNCDDCCRIDKGQKSYSGQVSCGQGHWRVQMEGSDRKSWVWKNGLWCAPVQASIKKHLLAVQNPTKVFLKFQFRASSVLKSVYFYQFPTDRAVPIFIAHHSIVNKKKLLIW